MCCRSFFVHTFTRRGFGGWWLGPTGRAQVYRVDLVWTAQPDVFYDWLRGKRGKGGVWLCFWIVAAELVGRKRTSHSLALLSCVGQLHTYPGAWAFGGGGQGKKGTRRRWENLLMGRRTSPVFCDLESSFILRYSLRYLKGRRRQCCSVFTIHLRICIRCLCCSVYIIHSDSAPRVYNALFPQHTSVLRCASMFSR